MVIIDALFNNPIYLKIPGRTVTFANNFLSALGFVLAILTALILHEVAHGFIAYKNGDKTAKLMGRLSLNPLKHLDPIGTIMMFLIGFGWAKPVPVNPMNYKHYKKGCFTVAIAGVTANIALFFISLGLMAFLNGFNYVSNETLINSNLLYYLLSFLYAYFYYSTILNLCLFLFNLLPIYPLDGFRVLEAFLRPENKFLLFMRRYSYFALLGLILLRYIANITFFSQLNIIGSCLGGLTEFIWKGFKAFGF